MRTYEKRIPFFRESFLSADTGLHPFEFPIGLFAGFGGLVSGGKPANPEPITITSVVSSYFAGALTGLACAAPSPAVPISAAAVPSMLRREMHKVLLGGCCLE